MAKSINGGPGYASESISKTDNFIRFCWNILVANNRKKYKQMSNLLKNFSIIRVIN